MVICVCSGKKKKKGTRKRGNYYLNVREINGKGNIKS
jgi:hypothetical protein